MAFWKFENALRFLILTPSRIDRNSQIFLVTDIAKRAELWQDEKRGVAATCRKSLSLLHDVNGRNFMENRCLSER